MEENTSPEQLNPASVAKSPDWSHWENLSTVSLREALQLSLGLDPNTHSPATEPNMLLREKFWERLMVAKNHAISAKWIVGKAVREDGDINLELTMVDLKKFAHWVVTETTLKPIPVEFVSFFDNPDQVAQATPIDEPQSSSPTPTSSTDPSSLPSSTPLTNHTRLLQPAHLNLNRDRESVYYFAHQPLAVLNDFMRAHQDSKTNAARALGIDPRVLGRVLKNVRAGKKPWADS